MKIYYRISDKSYPKSKLPGTNKSYCLNNCCLAFPTEKMICIADNCCYDTIKLIKNEIYQRDPTLLQTSLGNAGSFRFALLDACSLCDPEEIIYMLEDDYIHNIGCNLTDYIKEGLERVDYVTLYDHPDKYESEYNFGEVCKVFKTSSTHWRTTVSTTMTVAAKVKTFKRDLEIWMKHTEGNHPNDHLIFSEIKGTLAVCIPGASFHTDLTYYEAKGRIEIPNWLQNQMELGFEDKESLKNYSGLMRLILIETKKADIN